MNRKIWAVPVLAIMGAALMWSFWARPAHEPADGIENAAAAGAPLVDITIPDQLGENATVGETIFNAQCADCHGVNAVGREGLAPPLVHIIYEPSHHADEAFQRAVSAGVQQHHWPFGNMPPVSGLTRGDVAMVVAYIRELQEANGIN
ncbi:c-type cytochrome [Gymnodinialimonas ceratoperidinii]